MNSLHVSNQHRLAALSERVRDILATTADQFKPLNLNACCWALAPKGARETALLKAAHHNPGEGLGLERISEPWARFSADQQIILTTYLMESYNDLALWAALMVEAQGFYDEYRAGVNARRDAELRQELAQEGAMEKGKLRAVA